MIEQAVVLPSPEPEAERRPRYGTLAKDMTDDTLLALRKALIPVEQRVRKHQARIACDPFHYESYHALFDLYLEAEQTDKAYCVAATLHFLKKATLDEDAFFEQHRRSDFQRTRNQLSEQTFRRHVVHPDQDPIFTCVLGLIAPAIAAWRAVDLPGSVQRNECIDVSTDPSLLSRMIKYVRGVLDVMTPDVYLRPDDMGDLALINIKGEDRLRPTIVAFKNLLSVKTEPQLAFALGRYMMELYPPHFCFLALERSPQALKQVYLACLHAVGLPVQGDRAALGMIAQEIFKRTPLATYEQIRSLIDRHINAGGSIDFKQWFAASELTAYRVGLLLSTDLRVAAQMISQEQAPLGVGATTTPRDKIKELVLYSISEDYFAARRAIGVNVTP